MGWLWLGLVIGLLVGAGAVALVLRAVGKLTGTDLRSVGRLILDGFAPGGSRSGVAAQRALARRLRHAGERTASGRRVAAETLTVHVGPEDHDAIAAALGIPSAEDDLAEYYRDLAASGRWLVGAEPRVRIVRDISLRPRQSYVRVETNAPTHFHDARRAADPRIGEDSAPWEPGPGGASPLGGHPAAAEPADPDTATTDVLPRALVDDASVTAVYPAAGLLGDLVVVHGTDVRTVTPQEGALRIGRGRQNDLVLERPGLGRDHLVLEARGDAWWIVPGTTQSGTKVDGASIDGPVPIDGSASIELGRGVRVRATVESA